MNISRALMLLILPIILTVGLIWINFDFVYGTLTTVNLHILRFRVITSYHVVWIVCGFLSLWFYVGIIFVKGYWAYIVGAFLNVAVFVPVWMLWLLLGGQIDIYDTFEQPNITYHLVETRANANSTLYLFICDGADCEAQKIGFIGSSPYSGGEMDYNADTNQMTILADDVGGDEIEEIIVDLDK